MLWSSTINFMQIQNKVSPRFKIMDKTYFQERPWTWSWRRWSTRWWRTWTARRPTLLACPGRSSAMTGSDWPQTQTGKHILKHIILSNIVWSMAQCQNSHAQHQPHQEAWRAGEDWGDVQRPCWSHQVSFFFSFNTCWPVISTYSSFYSDVSSWATLTSYGWWKRYSNYCQ